MLEPLSTSRIETANNSFRHSRPDMYLNALHFNRSAYMSAMLGKQGMLNMTYVDPTETVSPMIRNLVGPNINRAAWHKLAL